jgi:1-acyl-sn-glycerol-3-phosphate acyltransferase
VIAATVPTLGPALPRRFGRWTRAVGAVALGVFGWRFEGTVPNVGRMVVVVAPHTSNWDFPVGIAAMLALGLRIRWLGKHTIFRGPFGALLRWLGGIPVRRGERLGAVDDAVDAFRAHDRLILALAPEGTRRRVATWKTGYYAIAERAGVPVLPVTLDWSRRVIGIGELTTATHGADALTAHLRSHLTPAMARRPEGY